MTPFRTHYRDVCLMLALLFGIIASCVAHAQMPPTNTVRSFTGPRVPRPVATNIVLSWEPYTNAWFVVETNSNLASTNWGVYTNIPISTTSVIVPMNQPQLFFRYKTVVVDNLTTN